MTGAGPELVIRTLGGFRVVRDGAPVPVTAWPSRKARDLVAFLVTRRGRPVSRETIGAVLWPGEAAGPVRNRLSVALSTARSVLGGTLVTEGQTVRLDLAAAEVDVLAFLGDARRGLRAWRLGRPEAWALLHVAESAYTGDFLADNPYADWAQELRDEARLIYEQAALLLAAYAGDRGQHVTASRYCLRVLEHDRYNEPAHLSLVAALSATGCHGEARRRYRTYVARMAEVDVEPRAFPGQRGRPDR